MRHLRGIDLVAPVKPARHEVFVPNSSVMDTLNTLREWEVLGARCGKYGHTAWLDHRKVAARIGNHYLHNIGSKLVCRCGNQSGNTVLVGRLGRH